jgi:hypothetical protein
LRQKKEKNAADNAKLALEIKMYKNQQRLEAQALKHAKAMENKKKYERQGIGSWKEDLLNADKMVLERN